MTTNGSQETYRRTNRRVTKLKGRNFEDEDLVVLLLGLNHKIPGRRRTSGPVTDKGKNKV